jgi:hypothetical protein
MGDLILPVAPFEEQIPYTRGGKQYKAVRGLNSEGYRYGYIEYVDLDEETSLTVRLVPSRMENAFNNYGVSLPTNTWWREKLYINGVYVKDREINGRVPDEQMTTNHGDMIIFGAYLGQDVIDGIFNGAVRCIQGFNEQPLFRRNMTTGQSEAIPDTEYDTTIGSDRLAYNKVEAPRHPDPVEEEETPIDPA